MALLEIPLTNAAPAFNFIIDIEGSTYEFKFRWNGRIQNWVFDLFDSEGAPIQTGNPFISGFQALRQLVNVDKPPGVLIALASDDPYVNADRFNIGNNVRLYYNESE
jgi:hypothetical protein